MLTLGDRRCPVVSGRSCSLLVPARASCCRAPVLACWADDVRSAARPCCARSDGGVALAAAQLDVVVLDAVPLLVLLVALPPCSMRSSRAASSCSSFVACLSFEAGLAVVFPRAGGGESFTNPLLVVVVLFEWCSVCGSRFQLSDTCRLAGFDTLVRDHVPVSGSNHLLRTTTAHPEQLSTLAVVELSAPST